MTTHLFYNKGKTIKHISCLLYTSAPADVPAMDGWTDALDVAIGKHEEYVAVREARIEALRQQLVQAGSETPEFFRLNA